MTAKHRMGGWVGVGLLAAALTASAQDRDLEADGNEVKEKPEAEMVETRGGDKKMFNAVTDDDISAVEVGAVYKNNGSFYKVVKANKKGKKGGALSFQRTSGMNDPTRTWTKISGLGPATLSSRETLWTLYLAGGGIMHPIALCMVVVIVVGINGLFILRRKTHYPLPFVTKSRECLLKGDVDGFKQLSAGERGLLGYICRAMTDESDSAGGLSLEAMQERSEMEANKQINRLRIPLKTLNVIAAVAPMLGLLGTVIGMVQCFEAIAFESASASKALTLAAGIRVALFTTVAGLLVAIPALIVMFLLNQKLNGIVSDTEIAASKFAHMIAKGAGAKPVADSVAPKA